MLIPMLQRVSTSRENSSKFLNATNILIIITIQRKDIHHAIPVMSFQDRSRTVNAQGQYIDQ